VVVSEYSRRLLVGHTADLAVAQAVVDEREELAGHSDARFVVAAPVGFSGGKGSWPPPRLASLYKSHDDYVRSVTRLVKRFEREGWLLPADARAVREEAARSDIP
jgi:hypothetical protein